MVLFSPDEPVRRHCQGIIGKSLTLQLAGGSPVAKSQIPNPESQSQNSKLQTPNSKLQTPNRPEGPRRSTSSHVQSLVFVGIWDLGFGVWDLGFGISRPPPTAGSRPLVVVSAER